VAGGILIFSHFSNSLMLKAIGAHSAHPSTWVAFAPFRWCLWHHPVDIKWSFVVSLDASPCPFSFGVVRRCLQLSNCCYLLVIIWFFSFIFSLLTGNVHHCAICFLLFKFSRHSIYFLLRSFSIYRRFILFNLVLQLQFLICLVFYFGLYFLKFLILSLALLLNFFSFNFIFQSIFFSNLILILLIFFFFY